MSFYRVFKSILQNSRLNREKFVNNKKIYSKLSVKNKYNFTLKRNFSSVNWRIPPPPNNNGNNNNNNNNNNLILVAVLLSTAYITNRFK